MDFLFSIERFLKGDLSYKDGVTLYQKHGTNAALKSLFESGEDHYAHKKLKTELQQMYDRLKQPKTKEYNSYSPSKKKGSINVELLPGHLKTEFYKASGMIREIAATNPTLIHLKTNHDRYESAKRIVELASQRKAIFLRCEYFLEHGKDPLENEPVKETSLPDTSLSFFEAQYRLKLARSRRSKLKGNIARLKDYQAVCTEIITLEKIIKHGQS